MPTAIHQVELSAPAADVHVAPGYDRCMLIFRLGGEVVGRAWVGCEGGLVTASRLHAVAASSLGADAARVWAEQALDYDERPRTSAPPTRLTVVVCTRERPHDLVRALDAISVLAPPPHEVLVVDNAPATTATREVVARYPHVRYVVEPRRGLNCARNCALRSASGDIVAFTDDDAVPEPGWAEALAVNFADPRVLCVTGLTLPLELETPSQELFEEHCSFVRGFARRVFDGRLDHPLHVSRVGAGASLAVRRSAASLVGWFDERLDAGTPTQSGGDHELFTRILLHGYRIVYEPRAVSWHRHRRTPEELRAVVQGYGTGVYAMWTGLLLEGRDLGVLRMAWNWFRWDHLPLLLAPSRWRTAGRDALLRAEMRGCLGGPLAWLKARRMARVRA
jgi:glycosyltransferase involved in cell wall biosynthesis